jgi:ubiquinone/menaquinone biosynthesis C-methylase UbiE
MLNLSHRSYKKELLDEKGIPFGILEKNLREIDLVNSLLGGHRVTLLGLKMLMDEPLRTYHIADIGCGNGGTLKRIARWARKKKINVKLTGIDINP